jgi:hypothetical protein
MAVFIVGRTCCPLCERVIKEGEDIISFSPFVANQLDPLWIFSDGVFHADCFHREPLSHKALERYQEIRRRLGPGNRFCVVCEEEIKDPDNYFTLGYLTEDESEPLYKYNYTQVHRSCLSNWPELSRVFAEIDKFNISGKWEGDALDRILADLARYFESSEVDP